MSLPWTKYWAPSDDGRTLKAVDLRNIQDDINAYITVNPTSGTVLTTTDQTISGTKTFSTAPVFPAASIPGSALTGLTTLAAGAGVIPAANLPVASIGKYKVGNTTHDISVTGTQDVTGVGFDPLCVEILACVGNAKLASSGFSDGTTQGHIAVQDGALADTWIGGASYAIRLVVDNSNIAYGSVTLISDGFRITWTKDAAPTGTAAITYKCSK